MPPDDLDALRRAVQAAVAASNKSKFARLADVDRKTLVAFLDGARNTHPEKLRLMRLAVWPESEPTEAAHDLWLERLRHASDTERRAIDALLAAIRGEER